MRSLEKESRDFLIFMFGFGVGLFSPFILDFLGIFIVALGDWII